MASKGFKILDELRYSTTKLTVYKKAGRVGLGTGFFFDMKYTDGKHCLLLVTNKHMAEDWHKLTFRINKADAKNNPILGDAVQITLTNTPTQKCIEHPDVDLCVFEVWPSIKSVWDSGVKLCYRSLHEGLLPQNYTINYVGPIEDIIMIGYPDGMADEKNNLPIVRRGITATDFKVDYNGKKEFLIDASIFKGSSGSPVLICNLGSYTNPDGHLILGDRCFFLGVQYRGEFSKYQQNIYVKNAEGEYVNTPDVLSANFNDLGFCVKSECLLFFKEEIKKQGWTLFRIQ